MGDRFWTSIYLIFLLWPILGFLARNPDPALVSLVSAGTLAFVGLYLRVMWTALPRPCENSTPWSLALMYVVAISLAFPLGELWISGSLFFLITALSISLSFDAMFVGVPMTLVGTVGLMVLLDISFADYWWILLQVLLFAGAIHSFIQLAAANKALALARTTVERLAVDNERLRFARDMHDILGHSLSVMTLKSQLAGRLVTADPDRARDEIEEVENMSRQALSDVRDAVAGYRALSLPEELTSARRALAAAGVRVNVSAAPVPVVAEAMLAWVVREGATNVVRHSGAERCRIRLGMEEDQAYVEMADDGRGPDGSQAGHGLLGLAERLHAVGGTLSGERAPGGGFLLAARLPVTDLP